MERVVIDAKYAFRVEFDDRPRELVDFVVTRVERAQPDEIRKILGQRSETAARDVELREEGAPFGDGRYGPFRKLGAKPDVEPREFVAVGGDGSYGSVGDGAGMNVEHSEALLGDGYHRSVRELGAATNAELREANAVLSDCYDGNIGEIWTMADVELLQASER